MPGFDGTGPRGQGAMTGGGRGYCAVELNSTGVKPMNGRVFYGRGGGRGYRNWFYATGVPGWQRASMGMPAFGGAYPNATEITLKQETDILKNQADILRKQLEGIQSRIEILEKAQVEKSE